jgi:hypothetical protein
MKRDLRKCQSDVLPIEGFFAVENQSSRQFFRTEDALGAKLLIFQNKQSQFSSPLS